MLHRLPHGVYRLEIPAASRRRQAGSVLAAFASDATEVSYLGEHMKPTILAGTLALAVLLWTGLAAANDVQGRVKAIEMTQKVITLDNGTRLFWTDDIPVADQLQSGDLVKARFEERGGRFVLTEIEIVV